VVIAERRGPDGNTEYNPRPASRLSAGDFLIVCCEPGQADALRDVLGKG
jgi:Trk K+ transport system NAD-binding subunit